MKDRALTKHPSTGEKVISAISNGVNIINPHCCTVQRFLVESPAAAAWTTC